MGFCPKCGTVMDLKNPCRSSNGEIERDERGKPVTKDNHTGLRTVGGAAAGAAVGSVIPVVGTLLGGIIGGAAGFISGICKDDGECTQGGKTVVVYECPKCHYWKEKEL